MDQLWDMSKNEEWYNCRISSICQCSVEWVDECGTSTGRRIGTNIKAGEWSPALLFICFERIPPIGGIAQFLLHNPFDCLAVCFLNFSDFFLDVWQRKPEEFMPVMDLIEFLLSRDGCKAFSSFGAWRNASQCCNYALCLIAYLMSFHLPQKQDDSKKQNCDGIT